MLDQIYHWLDEDPGWIGLAWSAWRSFSSNRGSIIAAAIAYYTLFSLFPLILFAIALSSFLIDPAQAQARILEAVGQYLPVAGDTVRRSIGVVMQRRSTAGLLAMLSLLWSASGVFGAISQAMDRAWGVTQPRPFWQSHLLALTLATIVGLLLVLSLFAPAFLGALQALGALWGFHPPGGVRLATTVLTIVLGVLTFMLIYRVVPNTRVSWRATWPGAVLAGIGWEVGKETFAWYLHSGLARFSLVYGSVGAIVALLLWSYLSGTVVLFGAELNAAIGRRQATRRKTVEDNGMEAYRSNSLSPKDR